jgi:hypothetical protein
MPGKSKKGGGLTSSPVYKKQKFGTPFKMKGSPYKQAIGGGPGEAVAHHKKYKAKKAFDTWMKKIIKKGGTTKSVISNVAKSTSKKALGTLGAYFGSMSASKADQPINIKTGVHKYTGEQIFKPFNKK